MRSTSQQVKVANSKLANFLRSKEDEEALLAIKPLNKRQRADSKPRAKTSKWLQEPDYSIPSSLVDRPRTPSGGTSFHFSMDVVTKVVFPKDAEGRAITWCMSGLRTPPFEHAAYIERDDAIENLVVPLASPAQSEDSETAGQELRDRAALVPDTTPDWRDNQKVALVSNISETRSERDEFWREVPAHESTPRQHQLLLVHGRDSEWWFALETDQAINLLFQQHALAERVQARAAEELGHEYEYRPFTCDIATASEILIAVARLPGFDEKRPPVLFESLRAGRIQHRFVLELPHEMSGRGRMAVLTRFCEVLGSIDNEADHPSERAPVGMMFTGTLHAPDGHNDIRNFHGHVVAHDRPAELVMDEDGKRWKFSEKKLEACRAKNFPGRLRRAFAEIVSEEMKAEGLDRHYDPRRYTQMGINRKPTKHLGSSAHALESIGVPTVVGTKNAISMWRDQEVAMLAEIERVRRAQAFGGGILQSAISRARGFDFDRPELDELWRCVTERNMLSNELIEEREAFLLCELNEARAKSRPVRTMRTCDAFLADIEGGRASAHVQKTEPQIRARLNSATDRLELIDNALAEYRPILAETKARLLIHAEILQQRDDHVMEFARAVANAARHGQPAVPMPAALKATLSELLSDKRLTEASSRLEERAVLISSEASYVTPTIEGKAIAELGRQLTSATAAKTQLHGGEGTRDEDGPAHDSAPSNDPFTTADVQQPVLQGPASGRENAHRSIVSAEQDKVEISAATAATKTPASDDAMAKNKPGPATQDRSAATLSADTHGVSTGFDAVRSERPDVPRSAPPVAPPPARSPPGLPGDGLDEMGQVAVRAGTCDMTGDASEAPDALETSETPETDRSAVSNRETEEGPAPSAVPTAGEARLLAATRAAMPVVTSANPTEKVARRDEGLEDIFTRIKSDSLLITRVNKRHYHVPGLTDEEAKTLDHDIRKEVAQDRLASLFREQHEAAVILMKFLRKFGDDAAFVGFQNNRAIFSEATPESIRPLPGRLKNHPAVRGFLRMEKGRREEAASLEIIEAAYRGRGAER